jgi:alpha-tubulin suppressor-like RCC1 family protein/Leucine-rich repeat (LRR) protein
MRHLGLNTKWIGGLLSLAVAISLLWQFFHHRGSETTATNFKASVQVSPLLQSGAKSNQANPAAKARLAESYGKLPLSFEANAGQTDPKVKFVARGQGYNLFLTPTEAVLALSRPKAASSNHQTNGGMKNAVGNARKLPEQETAVLRMKLLNGNVSPKIIGLNQLPGKSNYFIGNDSKQWHRDVSSFEKIEYQSVYRGIDIVYHGSERQLEYDFVVAPAANPAEITLVFEGTEKISVNAEGDLVLSTLGGDVYQHKPQVYQEEHGIRRTIAGKYQIKGKSRVGFQIATYDLSRPLVIDPVLSYSTYLGGSEADRGTGIALDLSGNAYVTGSTTSADFPATNAVQPGNGGSFDSFVTKLNTSGSSRIYSTYLGGSGEDVGNGIAVDLFGNAYVTGYTLSTDFPTTNAVQPGSGGGYDAFVAKLNPSGSSRIYSTYLGGSDNDIGNGIAVDLSGNAYVTGRTRTNFPILNAVQPTQGGSDDAFVTKLNPSGSAKIYSTYLGGNGEDSGNGIAVDLSGNAYMTGYTSSTNFPTLNAIQPGQGGSLDAFVTKLNPSGSARIYSTYMGGNGDESGNGIAVDVSGNGYVTGYTSSTNFPTLNAIQPGQSGSFDAFVTKLNPSGSARIYSTHLGGSGNEFGNGIAADSSGNAYITGFTTSTDFPTMYAVQPGNGGIYDAFVTKLNPSGSAKIYSTYLGGTINEFGNGIAVDPSGNAYVTGYTTSTNFPTLNAIQPGNGGSSGAFLTKLTAEAACSTPSFGAATNFSVASLPFAMAQSDFNNDGNMDLAVTNFSSNSVSVLLGDGNGSFGPATPYNVGIGPVHLAVGDFNNDGRSDLAVANTGSNSISILLGNNLGAFIAAPALVGIGNPQYVVTSDFNGDGYTDLAIAGYSSNSILIRLGDGMGNFAISGNYPVDTNPAPRPISLTVGDFNNDGKPDLAVGEVNSSSISTLLGNGTGGFGPASHFPAGPNPLFLAIGDVNGDGITDLISANKDSNNVSILLGDGNGGFGPPNIHGVGISPLGIAAQDLNGDGRVDLVATNNGSNNVSILTGDGLGGFSSPSNFVVGGFPYWVGIGDFNGDGRPDLAITNQGSNNVSILLNNCVPPPAPSIGLSAMNLAFAIQQVGTSSSSQLVVLSNTGNAPLNTSSIVSSGDFSQTNGCDTSLAPRENCTIDVRFSPTAGGARTGTLSISSNTSGSPHTVNLSGTGVAPVVPAVTLNASSLSFGTQPVGPVGIPQDVIITNIGTGTLTITSLALAGANPGEFRASSSALPITVAPGNSSSIKIQFAPTGTGARSASLTITNNTADSPQSVGLSGNGATASVLAWGSNSAAQLGIGSPPNSATNSRTPVQVNALSNVAAMSGGYFHTTILKSDGTVWAWGQNDVGQLGNGTTIDYFGFIQVSGLGNVTAIATGAVGAHTLALKSDGTLWSWGYNLLGQIGNGTTSLTQTIPAQVTSLTGVAAIAAGTTHSLAAKSDGTLWSWGENNFGQLGNGTSTNSSLPVQVSSLSGVVAVAGGQSHSLALKSDGTVWSWGFNGDGQLGNGTTTNSTVPVQVTGLNGITGIVAGPNHNLALKSDGTLWAWGNNSSGNLGNGTTTSSSVPVQVSNLIGVVAIAAGANHSLALKSDGSGWAWGLNDAGQLGNGTTANSSIPVQILGVSGGTAIAAGGSHSLAVSISPILSPSLSSQSVTFASQIVGTTSTAQTLTINNTGPAPFVLGNVRPSGLNSADFSITTDTCNGVQVQPGNNCVLSMTFTPTATGGRSAALTLYDNSYDSPQSIILSGTGISPFAGISPTSLSFGNMPVGSTSPGQAVTLANTGTAPLTIASITTSGDFARTSNCPINPATLASGANCTIDVTFNPTVTGVRSGSLTITSNASGSPHSVNLNGSGIIVISSSERQVLIDLHNSTNGTNWTNKTNWLGIPGTECTWFGVTCNAAGTSILALQLGQNNLQGNVPSSLGNLANMQILHLFGNQLSGTIPIQLGNLASLQQLYLYNNQLSGPIPTQLGNLSNLLQLLLGLNQLSDPIPAELGNLAKLQTLSLSFNQLSGSIPVGLNNLSSLTYLGLNNNQLTGVLPPELGNLAKLQSLYLYVNQLSGSIPASLANLTKLEQLVLDNNQLSGPIPTQLGSLPRLNTLFLRSNQLNGSIPASFANLTTLGNNSLDLRWNGLHTTDSALQIFLNTKQIDGSWQSTQTIAPSSISATPHSSSSVAFSWVPILYTGDSGRYEVLTSTASTGPFTMAGSTANKNATGLTLSGLDPETTYYFVVRTVTDPNGNNQNTVISEFTPQVSATTQAAPAPVVSLTPTSLTFASTAVGSTTVAQTVILSNTGNAALSITSIAASGDFAQTYNCGASLAASSSCSINTTFTPTAGGPRTGGLTITSNAAGSPHTVNLGGNGIIVVSSAERQALIDLYNSTNGANWTNKTNWLGVPGTECTWFGVMCNAAQTAVVNLTLENNRLNGAIPSSLGNLGGLQILDLMFNQLSGSIPTQLSNLTNLQRLLLESNQLSGPIPSVLANLAHLQFLTLRSNRLTGTIPPQLGSLINLETLFLSFNELSGSIPSEFGNLASLQTLEISSNQLTGSIPAQLGNLTNLQGLNLYGNQLTGSIPPELGNLANLRRLYLYANQLSGAIPAQLGNLANLLELYLFNNRLSGSIPPALGNLAASLLELHLSNNQLSGLVPSQLGNLVRLRALLFGSNKLVGTIPSSLANLTGLTTGNLDLRWNALYSADASLVSFLNSKQSGGDWQSTQTIAPLNVSATPQSSTSVALSWTPILYTGDSGRYEVLKSTASSGPYTLAGSTSNKSASGIDVTGLTPGATYYFVVQAATDPHANNQNTVTSEASPELSSTTPAPALNFSTTSLTFPNQLVGTTSPSLTVTLTNPGTASVTFSSISVTGNFTRTNNCGSSLAPGANCTVTVSFTPTAMEQQTGTLSITSNSQGSPHAVSLSGTGVAPLASLSTASISFGNQLENTTSLAKTVTLTNSGTAPLTVTSITLGGANGGDFAQSNTCTAPLTPTASCTFTVTFRPVASGPRSAAINIVDNVTGSPHSISLSGTGQQLSVAPTIILNFDTIQSVGTSSAPQKVTLKNKGATADSLIISATGDFIQTSNCTTSLAAGGTCTVNVTFTPTGPNLRSGVLSITDNVGTQTVPLRGTGSVVQLSATNLNFGNVALGKTSAPRTLTITNLSPSSPLSVSGIAITGTNTANFSQNNTCGSSVAPGAGCTVSLTMTPTATGARNAVLEINHNGGGSPHQVTLTGSGK